MNQKQKNCRDFMIRHTIGYGVQVFFKAGLISIRLSGSGEILASYDPSSSQLLLSDKWQTTNNWKLVAECAISQAQCVRENKLKLVPLRRRSQLTVEQMLKKQALKIHPQKNA